jgi:spermidine/putrescine-binding protein
LFLRFVGWVVGLFRWGALLVAFKREQLSRRGRFPIKTWSDLLQPGLRGRVAFPDNPREFVGIALKSLAIPGEPSVVMGQ